MALKSKPSGLVFPLLRISRRWLAPVLKVGITLAALSYIFIKLKSEGQVVWETVSTRSTSDMFIALAALILMPLNLGLESEKWRVMIRFFYPDLSRIRAFQAVLSGLATGVFTPNRIGEYAGRVLYLEAGKRIEAIALTFVDRICQMFITMTVGTFAFAFLISAYESTIAALTGLPVLYPRILVGMLLLANAIGFLVLMYAYPLAKQVIPEGSRNKYLRKIRLALRRLERAVVIRVVLLGLFRYCVFSIQYYLLMLAFGYSGNLMLGLVLIWSVFLVKSVIPYISLSELGVRESVAIAIMGAFGISAGIAFAATFVLYLFNIVLPSLGGLFFFYRIRLYLKE
jgi:uncharacterized protein (TIRG00374 family)